MNRSIKQRTNRPKAKKVVLGKPVKETIPMLVLKMWETPEPMRTEPKEKK